MLMLTQTRRNFKSYKQFEPKKAADFYGITAENIIHGGVNLLTYLQALINKSFEKHFIPDSLKIGTLFPVFKNKGDCKNAKNYRGITVTPTFSKVIEKILKIKENCKIKLICQIPLQRGFTENSSPLLCELIVEEFERENKDLKTPNIYRPSGCKICLRCRGSHANLIKRLHQYGGKIGNINCCAPTCADDVALLACNPLDIQTMVDIAVDFSKREGYHLQPSKSVILPVKSKAKSMETNLGFWKLNDTVMPVVDKASHIGITRSQNNSAQTTVEENLKKKPEELSTV
ncbi:Hypothetical predicted protein [Mytilus galloprovincialis]|uniref:Reverse transcriptase domain-containing protein n=1 Tax=Mytilus galloprovincialis TaxID=29158 RepID=A0A8B6D1K2_MYTGA|nr:Hypothetical predicted protein [Mytilus galloprovincialis]